MELKLQPLVTQGQFLSGTCDCQCKTSGVSHNALCFCPLPDLPFLVVYLLRNAITVVYPKKRLPLQHPKHSRFSHTGQKKRKEKKKRKSHLYYFLCFDVGLELWRTCNIIYSQNQGGLLWVSTARAAFVALIPKIPFSPHSLLKLLSSHWTV